MSKTEAVGQAMLNAPLGLWPAWLASGLMLIGIYRCLRLRENLWLLLSAALVGYAWVIIASEPFNDWRVMATGVWYTDPYRVAMILPLAALPLAALGAHHLVIRCTPGACRAGWRAAIVALVAGVLLVSATQRAGYMNAGIERFHSAYNLTDDSPLLSKDEYTLLKRLSGEVPESAIIATNPWNGSSLAYPIADRKTTNHHTLAYISDDEKVLNDELDEAATDPQVCPAVERLGVDYVLDFGTEYVNDADVDYPGFDELANSPGFQLIDHEGDARLYKVTACPAEA